MQTHDDIHVYDTLNQLITRLVNIGYAPCCQFTEGIQG